MLEQDGLKIRALEPEDLSHLLKWENDPAYWTFSQQRIPYSEYLLKEYLKEAGKDLFEAGQLRMVICYEDQGIGLVDLFDFDPDHQRAGIGILIGAADYQGQGLAKKALKLFLSYAFPNFNLQQVYAQVVPDNEASIQLFRACGFQEAGVLKNWFRQGDRFLDAIQFQFLKTDL